jgi:Ca2+-binding RTX toxin-like protein
MARIKYTENLGDLGSLRFQYTPDEMHTDMDASGGDKAVYIDANGGEKIILRGQNFAYLDGDLLKGSVSKIIFQDEDGHNTAVVSGVDFKAKQLDNLMTNGSNLFDFLEKIMSGRDTFIGSDNQDFAWAGGGNDRIRAFGGNDSVNGEGGNDVMTGGSGSDHFFFLHDDKGGQDVIKDFDAKGGGDNQDYIATGYDDVLSIKQVGDDVVLNYGDGNTLTLLDTDKSNISEADFHIPI